MAKTDRVRTSSERRVRAILHENPVQSYQDIAIATNFARCTVFQIIRRMEIQGRLKKVAGKGRNPNHYEFP